MKTLNLNEMERIEGGSRKFWGTGYETSFEADANCESGLAVVAYKSYYVFWMETSREENGRICVEN